MSKKLRDNNRQLDEMMRRMNEMLVDYRESVQALKAASHEMGLSVAYGSVAWAMMAPKLTLLLIHPPLKK
jgi:hypothetical protein